MAQSKNRRKNGKVVKSNRVKRMRTAAGYDLKNLMVCNVVDREELDGTMRMIPRTLMFDTKLRKPVGITTLQEVAIKTERWRWEVHYGVICRNPDGNVYLDKEVNFVCKGEYLLTELNETITDRLMEAFEKANHLHRLTMFWVAAPFEQESIPLEAVLSPVWHFNVLGNMLTQWENDNKDHTVIHYRTDKLVEFCSWFLNQGKYKKDLELLRDLKFYFEPTGEKMRKGELTSYRSKIQEAMTKFTMVKFEPLATVQGFCKPKFEPNHWFMTCNGVHMSHMMTVLGECPPCVNCIVEVRYADGREDMIKFVHNDVKFVSEKYA